MEGRKWEELPVDCLAQIFCKLEFMDLLESIPFVCTAWYKASLDPSCWTSLNLEQSYIGYPSELIKMFVRRSRGSFLRLLLPPHCDFAVEDLNHLSNECTNLKVLFMPFVSEAVEEKIPSTIGKLKDLEALGLRGVSVRVKEIFEEISQHCPNLTFLMMTSTRFSLDVEATAVVTWLPNITDLCLVNVTMSKEVVLLILKGCKKLVWLRLTRCDGFNVDDEIRRCASSIKTFIYEPPRYFDYDDYEPLCSRDVDFGDECGSD